MCVCHHVWSGAAIILYSRQKRGQPKKEIQFLGVSSYMHLHLVTQAFRRLTHGKTFVSWVRCEPVRCVCVCHQVKVLNLLCSHMNATRCTIYKKLHNRKSSLYTVTIFNEFFLWSTTANASYTCPPHLHFLPQGSMLLIMVGDMGERLRCIVTLSDVGP